MDPAADVSSFIVELRELLQGRMPPQADSDPRRLLETVEAVLAELDRMRQNVAQASQRLDSLLSVIVALASFDYSKKAEVTGADDVLDGVAFGLNMLVQELARTTVSKKYVRNIIESMSDPLVVTDAAGVVKSANRAAEALAGHAQQSLAGKSIELFFPGISVPEMIQRGGVNDEERVCEAAGGASVPVSFSASIMRNPRGEIEGVVCVARDLTESKRLDEERWKLRESVQRQAILLHELSTPLIPITQKVVVMPLVGSLDDARAVQMTEVLLQGVISRGAEVAIVDITGMRAIDADAVSGILRAVRAVGLIGAKVVLTGIRKDVARALVEIGSNLTGIPTFGTLERGILFALRHSGAMTPVR
jgi:rsbT co-antagonist protein RsbR